MLSGQVPHLLLASGPDVASSQPMGNEQCLLRGAQNTESVECAGQSGRRELPPLCKPWWERSWHSEWGGEEVPCGTWGWPRFWPAAQAIAIYAPCSLNSGFPYWLVWWLVTIHVWLLFGTFLG